MFIYVSGKRGLDPRQAGRIINYLGRIILVLILLQISGRKSEAQNRQGTCPSTIKQLWKINEHFVYNVRYGPFNLGTVTLKIMPDSLYDGKECRHVKATIESNPGLPFVGHRKEAFSSLMQCNDTIPYDVLYWHDDIGANEFDKQVYRLDYQKNKVYVFIKGQPRDTLKLDEPSVCGPAYFFYTRVFAGTDKHIKVPLYVDEKKNYITMDNTTETEEIKCNAYPGGHVKTYFSSGDANFDGPFGFNGHYKAWYSVGPLKVPIMAYLRVWLGNVKIRLVKYYVTKS